ncbi:MAG: GNAT family N-acetyltransferase [Bacteroidota bacterium]
MTDPNVLVDPFSKKDIQHLSQIHLSAFKGYMNAGMGKQYVQRFLLWFMAYPNAIALKAEYKGQICGYVVGAPIGYDKYINRDLFKTALVGILTHPYILFHQNFTRAAKAKLLMLLGKRPVKKVIQAPPGHGISLVGICVAPDFGSKGIGKAIMSEFEVSARRLGMHYMRLSVYRSNAIARSLYEKAGWYIMEDDNENVLYYYKMLN